MIKRSYTLTVLATIIAVSAYLLPTRASAVVYELRMYTANAGKLDELDERFRNHTHKFFTKHGMESIGYWIPTDAPKSENTLIYIIRHQTMEAAGASWNWFRKDQEWQKVRKESEKNGPLLAKRPVSIYMSETEFSPHFLTGSPTKDTVFELRISRAKPGRFDALTKRHKQHTLKYLSNTAPARWDIGHQTTRRS